MNKYRFRLIIFCVDLNVNTFYKEAGLLSTFNPVVEGRMEFTREIYWNVGHGPLTLVPMYLLALGAMIFVARSFYIRSKVYRLGKELNRFDSPGSRIGSMVKKGQVMCIVEAMKVMNEIEAEFGGVVKEILVENGSPVEAEAVLFLVDPE